MTEIVQLAAKDGAVVQVELESSDTLPAGMAPVGTGVTKPMRRIKKGLDDILGDLAPIADAVAQVASTVPSGIDQVSATLGFKLSIEGNLILAKTVGAGSLSVSIRWSRESQNPEAPSATGSSSEE